MTSGGGRKDDFPLGIIEMKVVITFGDMLWSAMSWCMEKDVTYEIFNIHETNII